MDSCPSVQHDSLLGCPWLFFYSSFALKWCWIRLRILFKGFLYATLLSTYAIAVILSQCVAWLTTGRNRTAMGCPWLFYSSFALKWCQISHALRRRCHNQWRVRQWHRHHYRCCMYNDYCFRTKISEKQKKCSSDCFLLFYVQFALGLTTGLPLVVL